MSTAPAVLVVDDEPSILAVCGITLKTSGWFPLLASTAREAMALVQSESRPIAAAVVDIVLPDMSGFELIRILRESGYVHPVVCTSGFPPKYMPERYGGPLENCYFLQKPFTPQQLRAILSEAWGRPAGARQG